MKKDVIIIGAGASGLMCAIEAAKNKHSVLVLERSEKIGKKIRVSGGGRCNFTNLSVSSENYLSHNPHFCKSALASFTPNDFISVLDRHAIRYHEKESGQLFCSRNSTDIVNMLLKECKEAGVEILFNCRITDLKKDKYFTLSTDCRTFESKSLVIATGGLSHAELGATDTGYLIARQFGIAITPLKPALVPLILNPKELIVFRELSGISVNAAVSCNGRHFRGDILFTHRGLSGPAILQISLYWNTNNEISINLLPDIDAYDLFISKKQSKMEMRNLLCAYFPKRFVQKWCDLFIHSKPLYQYNNVELKIIAALVHNWIIKPYGTEGYDKAEVTLGGIDTAELSSKTMEVKKVPGMYFIGELIDVTGLLGGYNLHWAWASGYTAGQYV